MARRFACVLAAVLLVAAATSVQAVTCSAGEEPSDTGCQKCPAGKYNDVPGESTLLWLQLLSLLLQGALHLAARLSGIYVPLLLLLTVVPIAHILLHFFCPCRRELQGHPCRPVHQPRRQHNR